ncbi:TPA: hypothetical protein N0F65_003139 [Lagenidium giganteum]|uniref:Uncharacterized protein n=1 Tax=Lagenidium giganteum TaxID=4803 RepID=A0AAV2YDT5_9STRA|nr:TPA: hypothetical protein N0F65_003139 [Lagenidium giganteum]
MAMKMDDTMKKAAAASSGALLTSLFVTPLDVAKVRLQSQIQMRAPRATVPERVLPSITTHQCGCCSCKTVLRRSMDHSMPRPGMASSCMRMSSCASGCFRAPIQLNGTAHALQHIFRTEGVAGLFSGLSPTMMIAVPSTVLYYISYDLLLQEGRRQAPALEPVLPMLAGSIARVAAATVTSPIELIRTRIQSDPDASGIVRTFRQAIRGGGYQSLLNGLAATLARDVPFSAIYWTSYEYLQSRLDRSQSVDITRTQRAFICGALSGSIAATMTTPFDVVKTLQQVEMASAGRGTPALRMLRNIVETRGVSGAFTGLSARVARVAPSCAIMIGTYELAKEKLGLHSENPWPNDDLDDLDLAVLRANLTRSNMFMRHLTVGVSAASRTVVPAGRTIGQSALLKTRYQTMTKPLNYTLRAQLHQTKNVNQHIFSTKNRKVAMSTVASMENVAANRPIAWWLFGCAGMVGAMIAVGGATRLTRSGLSMVTWKPHGHLPPMTTEEWEAEFELYKKFPEFQQRKNMTLSEFKSIYAWEYGHRMLGRTVGLAYALPLAYFALRKRLPTELYKRFGVLFALGATQGGIGWWMVRSGLEEHGHEQLKKRNEVRVSPYRLATHLSFAFVTLGMLLWTGYNLVSPPSRAALAREMMSADVLKESTRIRKYFHRAASVFGFTILSGAFVAGIDAGMAYNTFPKMGDQWIPDGIFDMEPKYLNFFENTPLVQFDHRVLALTTFAGYTGTYALARRPQVWSQLPQQARTALNLSMAAVGGQVLLGITTLLNCVPVPLAVAHQSGAIVLMTSSLWTLHSLNFARPAAKLVAKAL